MEINSLAKCVGSKLRVEPTVDDNCVAAAELGVLRVLHFSAREQKRTESLGVVGDDFLAEVIVITAITIGIAAKAADAHRAGE